MANTSVPHWLLFRLAPRAIAAVEQHKGSSTVLAVYEKTLIPAATRFMEAYSSRQSTESSLKAANELRRGALETLRLELRSWVAYLASSLPGLDPTVMGDSPNVAEDLIADAESLLKLVAVNEAEGRQLPPGVDEMKPELTAAIAAARAESKTSVRSASELSLARTELRDAAAELQEQLVSFRQVLRLHVGSTHSDYLRLRVTRATLLEEGDELSDEEASEVEATLSGAHAMVSPIPSSAPAPSATPDAA